jgi:hypothetical protein
LPMLSLAPFGRHQICSSVSSANAAAILTR